MGVAPHPGIDRTGASFELDRLELDDGRLVVRGWWFGVRGVRFVRPGLVVDGRRVLATLEHKPWVAGEDGAWIAAFPWKRGLDVAGVTLVVAPSIEVPLDRDLAEPEPEIGLVPAAPRTVVAEIQPPLREELDGVERQLDAMHSELREARALAAEREERCRELERAAVRERRAAGEAHDADDDVVRAHAMAVLDRDRALAQHAEAVNDREAAVRSLKRMQRQRDAAIAERAGAQTGRDEALAERDEVRRQRDELLLAHEALQAQMKGRWADEERTQPLPRADPVSHEAAATEPAREDRAPGALAPFRPARERLQQAASRRRAAAPLAASERSRGATPMPAAARSRGEAPMPDGDDPEAPIGVRTIPAARTVAASLHRARREREGGVTQYDMWAIRILGSVAALAFISLLVMILKAFFVF